MQILKNLPQVARNMGNSITSQPGFFRDQSLILASFALVLSRIAVANLSALKAVGTPEGPFRYQESIRTDIREIGGFTLGFLVLRFFQCGIRKGLRSGLGIMEPTLDNHYSLRKAWGDLTGKTKPAAVKLNLALDSSPRIAGEQLTPFAQKLSDLFEAPVLKSLKHKATATVKLDGLSEAEKVLAKNKAFITQGVYKMAPIIIGSIPTVVLAGYCLERVTRDHSEKIVDAVSDCLDSDDEEIPKPSSSLPAPASLPVAAFPSPQFGKQSLMVNPYRFSSPLYAAPRL
jgi:hypothetical protein